MANATDELAQLLSKQDRRTAQTTSGKLTWKFNTNSEEHMMKDGVACNNPIYPSRFNGISRFDGSILMPQFDSTMVGFWSFDDPIGPLALTIYDGVKANRNHGTIYGTAANWITGKYNTALNYDGSTNYVQIPDHAAYQITTAITVEAWIQVTQTTDQQMIFTHSYKNSDWTWEFFMFNGSIGFQVWTSSFQLATQYIVATPQVHPWQHIAGTYDGANVYCYVNGIPGAAKAATGSIATASIPMRIGGQNEGLGALVYPFSGYIDEVRLYNSALSAARIYAHAMNYRFP